MLFATLVYVFALLSLGLLVGDQGREPDAGAANVDDLHAAERFLFRLYFPARNDAVDLLRARRASSDDLFHRADARHHSARRNICSNTGRILSILIVMSVLLFCSLRPAVSEEDRRDCESRAAF